MLRLLCLGWVLWGLALGPACAQSAPRCVRLPSLAGGARPVTFYQLAAATLVPKAVLVLLPGRGEPARDVFRATRLVQEAAQRGFLVLVPDLNDRSWLDAASCQVLDQMLGLVAQQHPALARRLVLGGFSAGGQLAFAYAETLLRDSTQRPWRVRAVLGIDPPLDLAVHWQRAQLHMAQQDCPVLRAGDARIVQELTQAMGGSPDQVPATYLARSAYTRRDSVGGNARWLRQVPVRLYCEPDLAFWQQQYCPALQLADLNAERAAALVTCLQKQGNTRAQYFQTTGKGYVGKQRLPHSWSIVDAAECADWLQHCLD